MRKGMVQVLFANILCLLVSLLTNFILPKYLSISTYALIKEYSLYMSYAGFFSLGYNDGMYLKYGGKKIQDINKDDISSNVKTYVVLEFVMLLALLALGMTFENGIVIAFAFGMFVNNVLGYIKSLYQATGEFSQYSFTLNIEKISVFVGNLILLFVLKTNYYYCFIWIQIIAAVFIMIYLSFKLNKSYKIVEHGKISFAQLKDNVLSGLILMLGNFSSSVFTGLDRWFVKLILGTTSFAFYSYAVSMENLINTFMVPITVTMYNYFCRELDFKKYKRIKNIVLIWGFIVIAAAYPAKWILERYIPKYIEANSIIFILFAAQAFYVVIKGIYVNIYKSEKKQNKYLIQLLFMIAVAFGLNAILVYILKNKESIAIATLITAIIWLIICEKGYKEIRFGFKEILSIIIMLSCYLVTGYLLSAVVGLIVYCAVGVVVGLLLMRNEFIELFMMGIGYIKK